MKIQPSSDLGLHLHVHPFLLIVITLLHADFTRSLHHSSVLCGASSDCLLLQFLIWRSVLTSILWDVDKSCDVTVDGEFLVVSFRFSFHEQRFATLQFGASANATVPFYLGQTWATLLLCEVAVHWCSALPQIVRHLRVHA